MDIDSLGLNLNKEAKLDPKPLKDNSGKAVTIDGHTQYETKVISLRKVTEDVIAEINAQIQAKDTKRLILLDICESGLMKDYGALGILSAEETGNIAITEEELDQRWIYLIVQALIAKGHIFKLKTNNTRGFLIQV